MTVSTRLLLAASLCLAPLGWAAAQDQQRDDQHQRDREEPHQQPPPHNEQQQSQPNQQGNSAPRFQRPAQNNTARPSPPAGATASPTPPPGRSQFQRVQGSGQNRGAAPTGSASAQAQPQQQRQTTTSRGNFQGNTRGANTAAFAQHHGGAAPVQFSRGRFYGHDYAHFTPREVDLWRRGAWRHEFHDGRFGWWYAVDGVWYFYDEPIYPYPTFVPDVVYIPEEDLAAPPVYADVPPEAPPQYGQPPAYYYYFCPDMQAYYPYVTSCPSPWQPVPAAPPQ